MAYVNDAETKINQEATVVKARMKDAAEPVDLDNMSYTPAYPLLISHRKYGRIRITEDVVSAFRTGGIV